jgi:hypothetical protein
VIWAVAAAMLLMLAQDDIPNSPAVDGATRTYETCMLRAAGEYDDGRSDAASIGMAIEHVCATEWDALKDLVDKDAAANGLDATHRRQMANFFDREKIGWATGAVLTERRARREAPDLYPPNS